jgi:hypothetical protein
LIIEPKKTKEVFIIIEELVLDAFKISGKFIECHESFHSWSPEDDE